MLIARTQEESDYFVEQEISHCLRLNKKPDLLVEDGETYLVDNNRGCLACLPKPVVTVIMKTKKYGVLMIFDSIKDMLESKYNKGVFLVYCNDVKMIKRKRTTNKLVCFTTFTESYEFEDKEFSNAGGVYIHELDKIEKHEAYLIIGERNRFSANGIQIVNSHKLKREDNLYNN
jgi:hypothetical protein